MGGDQKAIAAPRQRLDVLRRLRIVAKRLANLTDAEIEALVEVDEGVSAPDLLPDFVPGDNLAASGRQDRQDLERLGPQRDEITFLSELAASGIELEARETENRRVRLRGHWGSA